MASASLVAQDIQDIRWTGDYARQKLTTILEEIQTQQPIQFFFRPEWTDSITYSGTFQETPLDQVMDRLLDSTELTYQKYQKHYIVLVQKNPRAFAATLVPDGNQKALIVIGDSLDGQGPSSATVSGYIRDRGTGQGLAGPYHGTIRRSKI